MPFDLKQRKALLEVMTSMFSTIEDFRTFLKDALGRNLDALAVGKLPTLLSGVIDRAQEREWLAELVEALKEYGGEDAKETLDAIDVSSSFSKARVKALRVALPDARARLDAGPQISEAELDNLLAGRLLEVAKSARREGAVDTNLRKALEQLGLLTETPATPVLEKIVRDSNSLLDVHNWMSRLGEIESRVCRVVLESGGTLWALGTGFLVGPDVVLTNHHVIASVLAGKYPPSKLRVQFDFHVLRNGSVDAGTVLPLASEWLIAARPHDPVDVSVHDLTTEPKPENLDFALLQLSKAVGSEPIGGGSANGAPPRGWIDLEDTAPPPSEGAPVLIVQHPEGATMKLGIDTDGVIGTSPNERRIRYRTNTLRGSSGSPVFNQDWILIALHHAGDPKYPELKTGDYNEGIPIRTLVKFLAEQGHLEKIKKS